MLPSIPFLGGGRVPIPFSVNPSRKRLRPFSYGHWASTSRGGKGARGGKGGGGGGAGSKTYTRSCPFTFLLGEGSPKIDYTKMVPLF